MTNLNQRCTEAFNQAVEKAEKHFGKKFPMRLVIRSCGYTRLGTAQPISRVVTINTRALQADPVYVLSNTVPHEVAHIVDYMVHGNCGHKRTWKSIMVAVFGLKPERLATGFAGMAKPESKLSKNFIYKCDCRDHVLTIRRHNKVIKKGVNYTCRECKGSLFFHRTWNGKRI